MPKSSKLTQKTQATLATYNNLVEDAHRVLAVSGGNLTIATDAITVAPANGYGYYQIDTEAAAATDDLKTITGGADGDVVALRIASASRVITLKHGTGNLALPAGKDFQIKDANIVLMLRFNGTNWLMMGGAGGLNYALRKAVNYIVSGGYMSTADKQANLTRIAAKSNSFSANFNKLIDGVELENNASGGVACNAYPFFSVDFGKPVALDRIRLAYNFYYAGAGPYTGTIYGSNTGDFTGEETTITQTSATKSGSGPHYDDYNFNPVVFRYWKIRMYTNNTSEYQLGELQVRFQSTFMISGVPYGSKVELYQGATLKESQTYGNTVYKDAILMFTTPAANFDTVKIYKPNDTTTPWLEFAMSGHANGDVYALILE